MTNQRLPVCYLSHGGGPWPWIPESAAQYATLDGSLKALRARVEGRVRAVLLVTAHWEAGVFGFSGAEKPGMIYDYGGFPPHTYEITYAAPGKPDLARQAAQLVAAGGLQAGIDPARGFDHGTFSVMQALWPEANMPLVQMSIRHDYDPAAHLAAGRLLAPLRDERVLILGSGLSYHNLRMLNPAGHDPSHQFDGWLQDTLLHSAPDVRDQRLTAWEQAPSARIAHPREDHLLPLMVAAGAAGDDAPEMIYHEDSFMGVAASSFGWGMPAR